jgi:hypothetical protein
MIRSTRHQCGLREEKREGISWRFAQERGSVGGSVNVVRRHRHCVSGLNKHLAHAYVALMRRRAGPRPRPFEPTINSWRVTWPSAIEAACWVAMMASGGPLPRGPVSSAPPVRNAWPAQLPGGCNGLLTRSQNPHFSARTR